MSSPHKYKRDTSVKAFKKINASGLLRKMQLEAYNILYNHGPLTANEVYRLSGHSSNSERHSFPQRIGELTVKGVVTEVGEKRCEITNRKVIVYDVTSKLPLDLPKRLTKSEKVSEILGMLSDLYPKSSHKKEINEIISKVKKI